MLLTVIWILPAIFLIERPWHIPVITRVLSFIDSQNLSDGFNIVEINYPSPSTVYLFFLMFGVLWLLILFFHLYTQSKQYLEEIQSAFGNFLQLDHVINLPQEMSELEKTLFRIRKTFVQQTLITKEAEQKKNDLVVYLAHDIKTPLISIIGYLNLISQVPKMPDRQRIHYISITLEKAYRLEELINEFFEITRLNTQAMELNKEHINLSLMLSQMADEFYPLLQPMGKLIKVNSPKDIYYFGDGDKLARVFDNIIKNAIAYSYENTEITIEAKKNPNTIIIAFKNHGDQIPTEKLETIFKKYYRLDSSLSKQSTGTGLGLAIAKDILAAHMGNITADSNEVETMFLVELPI